ncbi:MAG: methyl-accepting chemotaxis protein [Sulfuricella sp.]|nr:methyl-accepting chemotaxis protein [Sulfuricella sp.]
MSFIHNLKLRGKLLLATLVAIVGLIVISAASLYTLKHNLVQERQIKTRHLVETAHGLVVHYHQLAQQGALPEDVAKKQAIAAVKALRYDGTEYFWINDMQPRMVMHPTKPELDGKELGDFKDPLGKRLFSEMVDTVRRQQAGFVFYMWPKPGLSDPVEKLSYVMGFAPWGWIIGSGIYIDDVNAAFLREAGRDALLILAGVAVIALLLHLVARDILSELGGEPSQAKQLVAAIAGGDLSVVIPTKAGDTSSLLAAMKQMQAGLRDMIERVHASADQLTQNALRLAEASHQVSTSTEQQSHSVYAMATSVEIMTITIEQIAGNAKNAHATAVGAGEHSEQGGVIVHGAANEMLKISETVNRSCRKIETLGEQSQEISTIVSVIRDIADQTNLLALNAAIEAARAGEQGRGFAVVADEVRKLAERTAKSTQEITAMIGAIQSGTSDVVQGMAEGSATVKEGVRMATQAGEAMSHIKAGMSEVLAAVNEISSALDEETNVSTQISQEVTKVAQMTEANTQAIERVAQASDDLKQLALTMQQAVDGFRFT